jgi:hypothetical protein
MIHADVLIGNKFAIELPLITLAHGEPQFFCGLACISADKDDHEEPKAQHDVVP